MAISANAKSYAKVVHLDKARIAWHGHSPEDMHPIYQGLIDQLQNMTGWSEEPCRKMCSYHAWYSNNERKGVYIQFVGRACELVYGLSWNKAHMCTEIEVKGYVTCQDGEMRHYYQFIDGVRHKSGSRNSYEVTNGTQTKRSKSGAERSVKIGSNKSDTQSGLYARQGERPGLEVSVKRRRLRAAVNDVTNTMEGTDGDGTDRHKWAALVRKVAIIGYAQFESELMKRGVEPDLFFSHFTDDADYLGRNNGEYIAIVQNGANIVQEKLPL